MHFMENAILILLVAVVFGLAGYVAARLSARRDPEAIARISTLEAQLEGAREQGRQKGIQAVSHYVPLHLSPMGRKWGYEDGSLPVTEDLSARLLRLPLWFALSEREQDEVCDGIREFLG